MLSLVALACATLAQSGAGAPASSPNPDPAAEQVRLSEILIRTPQPYDAAQVAAAQRKAEDVREALRRGGVFAELARANSEGPTAAQGGDIGYFRHGMLAPSLEEMVFHMKVGDISGVVRTKQGFVIIEVTDRVSRGGSIEVLNAPLTAELKPYVQSLSDKVRKVWYAIVPYSARAPEMKQSTAVVEFSVQRDGGVTDEKLTSSSGHDDLDQAALNAIAQAAPFAAIPATSKSDHLALRFRFEYNPAKTEALPK